MDRRALLAAFPGLGFGGSVLAAPSKSQVARTVFLSSAHAQTRQSVTYDSAYSRIAYPMGDVAMNKGVCSDVVIRAYRAIGIDLQQLVHEDMMAHFGLYPKTWGLKRPDSNIDHRRVPNLRVFFSRFGKSLPVTNDSQTYVAGDLITYLLMGKLPHIAVVSDETAFLDHKRPLIIHNIGWGPTQEDSLFMNGAQITGHYRYGLEA